ncbi:MAG TPA: TetR/AcrR family transcriptional regulator [Clostridiales bacterium]|nr:TetR/AcrR family transcriptional regulator [Clostridiales bacterium]
MKNDILHRKDRLIITAIEIIDELGIQGLSTREIAKRQDVSEATLFRHYKSKNELLIAVLNYFSQFDEDIFLSTKLKNIKPVEAVIFLISSSVEYYENYPAITSIMQALDVLSYETELNEKVKAIINHRFQVVKSLVEDGQKSGDLRSDVDSDSIAELICGSCREICLLWRINGRNFSLKDKTLSTIRTLMASLSI